MNLGKFVRTFSKPLFFKISRTNPYVTVNFTKITSTTQLSTCSVVDKNGSKDHSTPGTLSLRPRSRVVNISTYTRQKQLYSGLAVNLSYLAGSCRHHFSSLSSSENIVGKEESDIQDVVRDVINDISKNDVAYLSYHNSACAFVDYMLSIGYELGVVREFLTFSPEVLKIPLNKLNSFFEALLLAGFSKRQVLTLSTVLSDGFTENDISLKRDFLQTLGFREKQLFQLLGDKPEIVSTPDRLLKSRVDDLKRLFKTADVYTLCVRGDVLHENWSDIRGKFDYVYHTMGVRQRQMVTSDMFSYSLEHIRNRHQFLERTGFYVTLKPKDMYKSTNPRLGDLLSLSDAKFAGRFGGLTAQEYDAFCAIMAEEQARREQGHDSDMSSDSDADSDDSDDSDEEDESCDKTR